MNIHDSLRSKTYLSKNQRSALTAVDKKPKLPAEELPAYPKAATGDHPKGYFRLATETFLSPK